MTKTVHKCALLIVCLLTVSSLFLSITGCSKNKAKTESAYLIRLDDVVVTVSEYAKALELTKTAYPLEDIEDPIAFRDIQVRLLNQMIEEVVLQKQAEEHGIAVTDEEVAGVVENIKKDYPEGEFDAMLLENVITYQTWEDRLRKRLLMEKVVDKLVAPNISVTPDEIAAYVKSQSVPADDENGKEAFKDTHPDYPDAEKLGQPDSEKVMDHLRRMKIEVAYKNWIEKHKTAYHTEINDSEWKKLLNAE